MRSVYPSSSQPSRGNTLHICGKAYRLKPWHHIAGGFVTLVLWWAMLIGILACWGTVR